MFEKFNDIIDAENLNEQQILDLYSDIIEMGDGDLISDTCYAVGDIEFTNCGAISGPSYNHYYIGRTRSCYQSYTYIDYYGGGSYLNYNDSYNWLFYCGSANGRGVGTYWGNYAYWQVIK